MRNMRGPASINMWPAVISGAAALIAALVLSGCGKDADAGQKTDTEVNIETVSEATVEEVEAVTVEATAEQNEAGEASTSEMSFSKVESSDISAKNELAPQGGALPAYEYPGPELFYTVVYDYIRDELGSGYLPGDVTIPCPVIFAEDESDRNDIRVYADFEVYNYTLNTDGETLMTVSGGSHPGCLHVASTDEGYEIISFDAVADGSDFEPSARKIFGDYYEEFQKAFSDDKLKEETRAQIIANYAAANGLNITGFQDYGWEKRALPTENIDTFYSDL